MGLAGLGWPMRSRWSRSRVVRPRGIFSMAARQSAGLGFLFQGPVDEHSVRSLWS